jgi:hypothetical protein
MRDPKFSFLLAAGALFSSLLSATTIVPIADRELLHRADVVVRGIVVSTEPAIDSLGRPETVTVIMPLEVLKGQVASVLVLHQLGGKLPDGRFFKLWGRPEYRRGHEVIVFALARPEGDYQTAELVLGKFEIQNDEAGQVFAVPALVADAPPGVTVARRAKDASGSGDDDPGADFSAPRELEAFLRALRRPALQESAVSAAPRGTLRSVIHGEEASLGARPEFVDSGPSRWDNGAVAVWTLDGQANITGGGIAEATGATVTWDTEGHSTIGYTIGGGGANFIHLDALSSPCGWSTCLAGGGIIGCGGPGGGVSNTWQGDTFSTITGGEVWLRSYCSMNAFTSVQTQAVLTHELGHTLGLNHSDQGTSPRDVCRGDENDAQMRAVVQNRTTLGTDDSDAVRWLYGDGGNSCGACTVLPPVVTTRSANGLSPAAATLNGTVNPNGVSTTAYFQYGTDASYGATTAPQSMGSTTSDTPLSMAVSGLSCGTTYHFRAVGTNAGASGNGSDMTFTTAGCPQRPAAVTNTATRIGQESATFAGSVKPNGIGTSAVFQYGTTTEYGNLTASLAIGSGGAAIAVSQAVFGLTCNTLYHYRIAAASASGTSFGDDRTLTTGSCTPSFFYTVTPCRVAETRSPTGPPGAPPLTGGADGTFRSPGPCGIPGTARSLSANVTVTGAPASGALRLDAAGAARPATSSIHHRPAKTGANSATISPGAGGNFATHSDPGSGTARVIVDVNGHSQ